jgi:hypothetical protein
VICFILVLSSEGALQWTVHRIPREGTNAVVGLYTVAFGNGKFLAATTSGEIYSAPAEDPHAWTRGERIPDVDLHAMIYAAGKFATVGMDLKTANAVFLSSSDGMNWSRQRLESSQLLHDVAYGNGRFVVIGQDIVGRSTDGVDWVIDTKFVRNPIVLFQSLDFVNGEFIATFEEAPSEPMPMWPRKLAISADGINWQEHGPFRFFQDIAYGRKMYVALEVSDCVPCGAEVFSADARTSWERQGLPGNVNGEAILYANGVFAVTGMGQPPALLTSTDGMTWDAFPLSTGDLVYGLTFGRGRFVAVGTGLIAVSEFAGGVPQVSNWRVSAEEIQFDFNAEDKTEWQVEASEDLLKWEVVKEIEGTTEGKVSLSISREGKPVRFLRVKEK